MTLSLCPHVFTSRTEETVHFLRTIGCVPVLSSRWGYTMLRCHAGYVAVHPLDKKEKPSSCSPGNAETQLVLAAENIVPLTQHLEEQGLNIRLWDEAWAQQAAVIDPNGAGIWLNELNQSDYGYTRTDAELGSDFLEVSAVRYSTDFDLDRHFFQQLGFTSDPGADEWWEALSCSPRTGVIGLHKPVGAEQSWREEADNPVSDRVPIVRLGFNTAEPLERLADRLSAAGFPAQLCTDQFATKVHVTTPDGLHMEIHPLGHITD